MESQFLTKLVAALLVPCVIFYAVGCYSYQDVTLGGAKTDEHLIVGTKGGHYYRFAEWTADSLGNISGRGAEYAKLAYAKSLHSLRPFKGTIPADSIYVLQADQPDTEATIGLIVAIVVTLGVILFVAAQSFHLHFSDKPMKWG